MKTRLQKITALLSLIILIQPFTRLTAQVGTGYTYAPSYVAVTGGGNIPDSTNGYTCNCDGTGATDATACLQAALNTASAQKKPLLIPYTSAYYKISGQLSVNCSVMGIGGMPTIKQTSRALYTSVFRCVNNMSGWIYGLHIVGTYNGSNGTEVSQYNHLINLGGVNGVTICNNILEKPEGDCVTDNAQENDANQSRNVLITNNSMLDPWRCNISFNCLTDNWAILNNYCTTYSSFVTPIDIEPYREQSYNQNIEIAYNNMQSPNPAKEDASHFYNGVITLAGWFDRTPGGNIFIHHNYGKWGVPITKTTGYQGAASTWTNVSINNNIQGNSPPASSDKLAPSAPTGLTAAVSDSSFVLSWNPSTDNVAVTGYEVFKSGVSVGKTINTSLRISGMLCSSAYSMTVKARDAVINWSDASTPLIVISPYCFGSDTLITFEDRPATETGLSGNYAGIDWGLSGWATYNETGLSQASKVLKLNSAATTQQTDTLIFLSGKTFKSLDIAALGNPGVKEIIISSAGNPDVVITDMIQAFTNYKTGWKIVADTIIIKITCDAGASSVIMDNLAFGDAEPPSVPAGLASSLIKFTSATLSWTASADNIAVSGYEVFKGNVSIGTTSATSIAVTGLSCNTEYIFTVKAKDLVGNLSETSEPFGITTLECDIIAPAIPDGLKAGNITSASFVLSWKQSTDNDRIAGYDVFKDGVKLGATTIDTSMIINGLVQNTSYAMTVKAKDPSGNISAASVALLVTTDACVLPSEWKSKEIGATGQSSCESNGVFTIKGAGADIWETADQFIFTYKSIDGNGVIIAKVESMENPNAWAKSGVMIRESLDANSKFLDCVITPVNGASMQGRLTTGGSCFYTPVTGMAAPYWVKLERIGNAFNAYISANGTTWAQIGKSTTATMSTKAYFGLAVTSHLAGTTCTSVISNVSTQGLITDVPEMGINLNPGVRVYPNPLTGQKLIIEGAEGADKISIFDITGRLVFSHKLKDVEKQTIILDNKVQKGTFIVKITTCTGTVSQLLIVQ